MWLMFVGAALSWAMWASFTCMKVDEGQLESLQVTLQGDLESLNA